MVSTERWMNFLFVCAVVFLLNERSTNIATITSLKSPALARVDLENQHEIVTKAKDFEAIDAYRGQLRDENLLFRDLNKVISDKLQKCEHSKQRPQPPPPPPLKCPTSKVTASTNNDPAPAASGFVLPEDGDVLENFLQYMNKLCSVIKRNVTEAREKVAVTTIVFCMGHVGEFRRGYSYIWDIVPSTMGYYRGSELYPYQMGNDQYQNIVSTIMEIPHKALRDELETKGFVKDDNYRHHYGSHDGVDHFKGTSDRAPRGTEGPRVLFMGCGSDVPIWKSVMDFLGGNIIYLETDAVWMKECQNLGADQIYLINYTTQPQSQQKMFLNVEPPDGDHNKVLTTRVPQEILDAEPFDVIVVDGPGGIKSDDAGRGQALYLARSLANSYNPNHHTHVFLHDAARIYELFFAESILGHNSSTYLGNTLPRKGLKHWRLPGQDRKFDPNNNVKPSYL